MVGTEDPLKLIWFSVKLQAAKQQEEIQKIKWNLRRKPREGSAPSKTFAERANDQKVMRALNGLFISIACIAFVRCLISPLTMEKGRL
jgi:hypothetical protein